MTIKPILFSRSLIAVSLSAFLFGCGAESSPPADTSAKTPATVAPGAPGASPTWAFSGKTGIGTSYEPYTTTDLRAGEYKDSAANAVSRVWFSLAQGVLTETMYGLIHNAQLKEAQFIIAGKGFVDAEKDNTVTSIDYLHKDDAGRPLSLAYKVVNKDIEGKYQIEKHFFTDPDRDALMMKVIFTAFEPGITPYLYVNPHVDNSGANDIASISSDGTTLFAETGNKDSTVISIKADIPFVKSSAGFVGRSDGMTDLKQNGHMDWQYQTTTDHNSPTGNVALTAQLPSLKVSQDGAPSLSATFVIGFGPDKTSSIATTKATLDSGYDKVLSRYNGEGEALGWQDYLASLDTLPAMTANTTDNGKLLYASALVLKAQEDKTHAGALIASLSNPWGDTVSAYKGSTGYKAVWPRDFYQCAMAFLAMGDSQTPKVAFEYLKKVQVSAQTLGYQGVPGWFLQKTHVDGEIEWVGVQLDQTAMPIMLGWKLWQAGVLTDIEISHWYHEMLKPAAEFLVTGGDINLDWNHTSITPLKTQQERWEEQQGYSPSTAAAVIAGLIAASDIAKQSGDQQGAIRYLDEAKLMDSRLSELMITTQGLLNEKDNSQARDTAPYYVRLAPTGQPNSSEKLADNNGKTGLDQRLILDGGFLELVRYGVRSADDPTINHTVSLIDNMALEDNLRVKYLFTTQDGRQIPGFRRYGNDGYGEDTQSGANYAESGSNTSNQRGRVWPFFTGERGHFELAKALATGTLTAERHSQLKNQYVKGMEYFANDGLMLPEQAWDGVGHPTRYHYQQGQGTNSATPLAWTHAEYVKLVRSMTDNQVWDKYPIVSPALTE
ncbi:glycoside hydrolase family 15 protein [Shewanella psychrotolerans]|uniref:glycoside hydrolase family 15 protein n=1 Tax=Shewanella psychrotolerans TaxID=2864206 RepID=UPI001C656D02|nr:glycoside hydrolase family 15 protein [Shewanella psychrotolerans]QYJ99853.1 glucan 1,4-alpha-glucosidase [Shewanella psychrotolerans]